MKRVGSSLKTKKGGSTVDTHENTEFRARLVAAAEYFGVELSSQSQMLYFEALRDLPSDEVFKALGRAIQTNTFMPKVAELRIMVLGSDEDRTEAAWLALRAAQRVVGSYASLAVTDAALGEAVVHIWGSWPAACQIDLSPEMWASTRKQFGRVYKVLKERNLSGPRYLPGICEQANHGHEDWLRWITVGVIGAEGTISQLRGDQAELFRTQLAAARGFTRMDGEVANEIPISLDETA